MEIGATKEDVDLLFIQNQQAEEIIRLKTDGTLYWMGRKVETDQEFVSACTEMVKKLTECMVPNTYQPKE